jgi:hypothetical protein
VSVSSEVRALVRRRADDACEYCRLPAFASVLPHQVDHIIGRQHRGSDDGANLCLCCIFCNLKKGPIIASIDPTTGAIVPLYDPRRHQWKAHFQTDDSRIVGLTPEGRATVELLGMNSDERVQLRRVLLRRGWRP